MKTNGSANTRLSVLVPAGLHARLTDHAKRAGLSMSEVVRRVLDAGLPVLERGNLPEIDEQRENLLAMRRIRESAPRRYGVYQGDLVAEIRAERDLQVDRILWPDLVPDEDRGS
jgi:hypothetical protein